MRDEPAAAGHHPEPPQPYAGTMPGEPQGIRQLLRAVAPVLGDSVWRTAGTDGLLEGSAPAEAPTIADAQILEEELSRRVTDTGLSSVRAFLDGVQRTRLIGHVGTTPIAAGTVAAVVRVRADRRLQTWEVPMLSRALFVSRDAVGEEVWQQLRGAGVEVVDSGAAASDHPLAQRYAAVTAVGNRRETYERALCDKWVENDSGQLLVDGGVSAMHVLATLEEPWTRAIGVVKSHNTLYGSQRLITAALMLAAGERSAAILIRHRLRLPVISWYLRLRGGAGGDPMKGLVRVEFVAPGHLTPPAGGTSSAAANSELREVIDEISASLLAERSPASLPDQRWDRLLFGVHDCEQYLDAITGPR